MWRCGWGSQQGASGLVLLLFSYLGLAGTLYMTGIAWFVQLVHYPLLGRNSSNDFTAFARAYQRGTLWVVIPGLALQPQVAVVIATVLIASIMVPFRVFLNVYLDIRTTDPAVSTSSR